MKLRKTLALTIALIAVFFSPICDAKIWYQYDFEPDEGDWILDAGTSLSTKYSHSRTHSISSDAKGVEGRYATMFLDMIPQNVKTIVDVIWVYHDGKNTSPKEQGTHHLSSWSSTAGITWYGPHLISSLDNEIGYWPYHWSGVKMKPNTWYRIRVVIHVDSNTFDAYCLEEGKSEKNEIQAIEAGVFPGNPFPMPPYRKFGAWLSPGVEAYFDDYSVGDEAPPLAVAHPGGKLSATWGEIKSKY